MGVKDFLGILGGVCDCFQASVRYLGVIFFFLLFLSLLEKPIILSKGITVPILVLFFLRNFSFFLGRKNSIQELFFVSEI